MTMVLALGGGLLVFVLVVLLAPLWRFRIIAAAPSRGAYDLGVYKEQLADIDRDVERRVVDAVEAQTLRMEVQRRLLKVADEAQATSQKSGGKPWGVTVFVMVLVPVISVALYGLLGAPNLPDQPFSQRQGKIAQMQSQVAKIRAMVDGLSARLQANPNDGEGWAMLGRSLRVLGQSDRAKSAFERAMPLLPNNTQIRLEYASLLIEDLPAGMPLPPKFVEIMQSVMAIDPNIPDALYFVGLAEAQAGHPEQAKVLWTKLLDHLPPDSPDIAEIKRQIKTLKLPE